MTAARGPSQRIRCSLSLALLMVSCAATAQEAPPAQQASPPERIDILAKPVSEEPEYYRDCVDDQDAAVMTGEIVVCRTRSGDENRLYDKETAERRHAERTQGQKPIDLFGIPDHGVVVARGCFIPPCPPPMPILIDIEALPEAPPGSDADRIGRGLAPRGSGEGAREGATQSNARELGIPPPPGEDAAEEVDANPSGSASPEAEPRD